MSGTTEPRINRGTETTRDLNEMLTWEWQPLEDLIEKAIPKVHPGKGLRKYEDLRAKYEEQKTREAAANPDRRSIAPRPELSREEKIRSGQKSIVMSSIRTLTKESSPYAEVEERDGVKMIRRKERRKPQAIPRGRRCPTCGVMSQGQRVDAGPKALTAMLKAA